MKELIEKAIKETLVIENKQSIHLAVEKILKLIENDKTRSNRLDNPTA